MRRLAILTLLFLPAGCAVPPALTLASFAADGVSYLSTGKSTTDHALSAIADEDCALIRAVKEKPICVPKRQILISMSAAQRSRGADTESDNSDPGEDY